MIYKHKGKNNMSDDNIIPEIQQNNIITKIQSTKFAKFMDAKRMVGNWNYLFEQFPEIEKIGSRNEYMEYVQSIFPESTIKRVFFHGGRAGIDKFLAPKDERFEPNKKVGTGTKDYGIYFTADRESAQYYSRSYKKDNRQIYPVVLNMKKPLRTDAFFALDIRKFFNKDILNPQSITEQDYKKLNASGYDSVMWQGESGEAVVFNPEQIHILGTVADMNNFKKWKQNKNMSNIVSMYNNQQKE